MLRFRSVCLCGLLLCGTGFRHDALPQTSSPPLCAASLPSALQATRGTWWVSWLDRSSPGRYVTSQAEAVIEPSAGGCGLLERFEGTRDGRPFSAVTLLAPAGHDSLQRIWQDSEHGELLLFRASADSRPLHFEWHRDLGDRVLRLRLTYRVLRHDAFSTETELSPDGGRTWELVGRSEYRRQTP